MTHTHYERLSFQDTTYLAMERGNSYMHIAAVQVFEAGSLTKPDGGIDIDRIRAYIAAKLHHVPRYRQRLAWIPLDGFPVWVDDDRFNIDFHVRHTSLPRPGGDAELKRLAARVFAQQLDRSKPLWELWVVEGLDGERFAVVVKVHHSMIDGMEGVDLLKVLLSLYPDEEMPEPVPWEPRPAPTATALAVDEAVRIATLPLEAMKTARDLVGEDGEQARVALRRRVVAALKVARAGWFTRSAATPVNQKLGPNRRFEWLTTPLTDVKYVKNHLGGTVNDAVLAVVAGAVRHYLGNDEADRLAEPYRVMVPVSVRRAEERGQMGNQVAMWLVELPVAEADPVRRLEAVRAATDDLKANDAALGATTLTQAASFMPLALLSFGVRLAWSAVRPFNMTVTNVPGPQIPIYMLGSKMVAQFPMVPLFMDHGIGIALFSYDGDIDWGLSADYDLVPDLDRMAEAIEASLAELRETAAALEAGGDQIAGLFDLTDTVSVARLARALDQDPAAVRAHLEETHPAAESNGRWKIDQATAAAVAAHFAG